MSQALLCPVYRSCDLVSSHAGEHKYTGSARKLMNDVFAAVASAHLTLTAAQRLVFEVAQAVADVLETKTPMDVRAMQSFAAHACL